LYKYLLLNNNVLRSIHSKYLFDVEPKCTKIVFGIMKYNEMEQSGIKWSGIERNEIKNFIPLFGYFRVNKIVFHCLHSLTYLLFHCLHSLPYLPNCRVNKIEGKWWYEMKSIPSNCRVNKIEGKWNIILFILFHTISSIKTELKRKVLIDSGCI
jgi:hypothetical protein